MEYHHLQQEREPDQEHELHGADIPDQTDMEAHVDMSRLDEDENASKVLEDIKKRLEEIEVEARAISEMQAKLEKGMDVVQDSSSETRTLAEKEEADARSIYVGNVDYACTPEKVQQHFQSCGTVNRVTILTDNFGRPKGYAYVEFDEPEANQKALLLNESELHGRQIKVAAKRTNIPGMTQLRGWPGGFRSRRPYMPGPSMFPPHGYGPIPRARRPMRYRPY